MTGITRVSKPTAHPRGIQRETCLSGTIFYYCGNFRGCCSIDPCAFLHSSNPCDAALASLAGQDGDDDDGDDDDDDEGTTATVKPTSTKTSSHSSTKGTSKTTTSKKTLTSSSIGSSFSITTVGSSTTTNSITSASSTLTPTALANGTTEASGSAPLSGTTLVGVVIGAVVGGVALLLLAFWLVRRRRLSKRMSSLRGHSPAPGADGSPREKDATAAAVDHQWSATGTALGSTRDAFAEMPADQYRNADDDNDGGMGYAHCAVPKTTRLDEGWPLLPQPGQQHPRNCAELDSVSTERSGPGAVPSLYPETVIVAAATTAAGTPRSPGDSPLVSPLSSRGGRSSWGTQIHPPQLTPGLGGGAQMTMMAAAAAARTGDRSPPVVYITNQDQNQNQNQNQNQDQDQNRDRSQSQSQSQSQDADGNDSTTAPGDAPRATLNATDHERKNNLYANSWANVEGTA